MSTQVQKSEKLSKQELIAQLEKENPLTVKEVNSAMADAGVSSTDLMIPKLLLMANTSEMVSDGKAKMGDVINSQNLEVIGSTEKSFKIIPLRQFKTIRISDKSVQPKKFLRMEVMTPENEKLPWDDEEYIAFHGKKIPISRDHCLNFFVLLQSDIDAGSAFPAMITFKRTSIKAGRQLASHMFKLGVLGRLPYSQSVEITVKKQKKDSNTWAVFECGKSAPADESSVASAKEWINIMKTTKYTVDEKDEKLDEDVAESNSVGY